MEETSTWSGFEMLVKNWALKTFRKAVRNDIPPALMQIFTTKQPFACREETLQRITPTADPFSPSQEKKF